MCVPADLLLLLLLLELFLHLQSFRPRRHEVRLDDPLVPPTVPAHVVQEVRELLSGELELDNLANQPIDTTHVLRYITSQDNFQAVRA